MGSGRRVQSHEDLEVFQLAFKASDIGRELLQSYDQIIGKLVRMIIRPEPWLMRKQGS